MDRDSWIQWAHPGRLSIQAMAQYGARCCSDERGARKAQATKVAQMHMTDWRALLIRAHADDGDTIFAVPRRIATRANHGSIGALGCNGATVLRRN